MRINVGRVPVLNEPPAWIRRLRSCGIGFSMYVTSRTGTSRDRSTSISAASTTSTLVPPISPMPCCRGFRGTKGG